MEAVFIVFMSLVSLICVFAILLILKDMLEDTRSSRQRKIKEFDTITKEHQHQQINKQSMAVATPVVSAKPVRDESALVVERAKAEKEDKENNAVSFAADGVKMTLDDKYMALTQEAKGYYDEIVKCANGVDGVKRFKNSRYEEYKVGNSRIVRLLIKRDTVICELIIQNSDFKDYVSQNKVAIRPAPTILKITDIEMLKTACDSIAIVVKQVEAEKEAKRLEMLERRREKRRAKVKAETENT